MQLGSTEPAPPRGSHKIVGHRRAWSPIQPEEPIVLDPTPDVVVKAIANVPGDLKRVTVVATADGAGGRPARLSRAAFSLILEAAERNNVRIDAIVRLGIDKIPGGDGGKLIRILYPE